eukprot:m.326895 g.326895  ORF g.326895 m.326895 type:complete len:534 (+) comp16561_c0_seq12:315-1916(+)
MEGVVLFQVNLLLSLTHFQSVPKHGLELWLSAHDLALRRAEEGLTNEAVETWTDLSGQGRHATADKPRSPVTFTNSFGGRTGVPAVHFNVLSTLKLPPIETIPFRAPRTFVLAVTLDKFGSGTEIIGIGTDNMVSFGCDNGNQRLRMRNHPSIVYAKPLLKPKTVYVITITSSATRETMAYINGVRQDLVPSSVGNCAIRGTYRPSVTGDVITWTMNSARLTIGGPRYHGHLLDQRGFAGDVAELLVYNKALNDTERQQVESHVFYVTQNAPSSTTTTSTLTTSSSTSTTTSISSSTTSTSTSSTYTSTSSTQSSTTTHSSTSTSTSISTTTSSTTTSTSTTQTTTSTSTTTSSTATTISTQSTSSMTVTTSVVSATTTTKTYTALLVVQENKSQFIHVSVAVVILLVVLNCLFFAIFVYLRRKYSEIVESKDVAKHKPPQPFNAVDDLYVNATYEAPENYEIATTETTRTNEQNYDDFGEQVSSETKEHNYDDFGDQGEQDEQQRGSQPDYWYNEPAINDSKEDEEEIDLYC